MLSETEKMVDLRVKRTLGSLQQALMELMSEKTFQAITVQEIADRAMVNRATFYDHFDDKYALLEHSMREWFRQTLNNQLAEGSRFGVDAMQQLILIMCEFLVQINTHCAPGDKQLWPIFETQVTTLLEEIMTNWLKEAWAGERDQHPPHELAASVASWAIYGAALHWSQHNRGSSVKAFVAQVTPMILAGLEKVT